MPALDEDQYVCLLILRGCCEEASLNWEASQGAEPVVRAWEQEPQKHSQLRAEKSPLLLRAGRVPRGGEQCGNFVYLTKLEPGFHF